MHIVDMILSSAVFIGLVLTWKDYNARWMFLLLSFFQLVDVTFNPIAIQWTRHYYLWCLALNTFFLFLILTRGVLAGLVFRTTKLTFFKKAREHYCLTIPECAVCIIIFCSMLLNVSIWIEIQLYYYEVLNYPFIYHHLWSPAQYTFHILDTLALFTFMIRSMRSKGELVYERN
uniref:Uncharacterized protein n=1 Tax=Pseudoalteromonas rubra TaxID=43658 RepID=A0A0F4QIJ3_9GAMM|nr:hypothetical protein TW77_15025 [Pseudoalteromonas rubra]